MRSCLVPSLVVMAGTALGGCTSGLAPSPPAPIPLADPWRPDAVLRATLAPQASGQVVLNEQDGLSPGEAAIAAIDHNPMLRAFRARRGIARAEVLAAGILPNPQLEGSAGVPVAGSDANVLGYGVGLSWNVAPLLSRATRVGEAREHEVAVDLEVAWKEWQVGQAARLHATRLLFLRQRLAVARQAEEFHRQRMELLRRAGEAQAVTQLEVGQARRSLAEWTLIRHELAGERVRERSALAEALGADPTREPLMQESWHPSLETPATEDLLANLPERRLDLVALRHARRSQDLALRAAALARFPPVHVGLRAGREVDEVSSASLALSFEIPVLDRNQAGLARERARRGQVEDEYAARFQEARAQVVRHARELDTLLHGLSAARDAEASAAKLSGLARSSATALDPTAAVNIEDGVFAARLRRLETEQAIAETRVALSISSGCLVRD